MPPVAGFFGVFPEPEVEPEPVVLPVPELSPCMSPAEEPDPEPGVPEPEPLPVVPPPPIDPPVPSPIEPPEPPVEPPEPPIEPPAPELGLPVGPEPDPVPIDPPLMPLPLGIDCWPPVVVVLGSRGWAWSLPPHATTPLQRSAYKIVAFMVIIPFIYIRRLRRNVAARLAHAARGSPVATAAPSA